MRGKKPGLLVVDDEAEQCGSIKSYFSKRNFLVWTAANGKEALNLIRKNKPDLVLLDMKLEGSLEGRDVLRILRESDKETKVAMITGDVLNEDEMQEIADLGIVDFLFKPVEVKTLENVIKKVLAPSEPKAARFEAIKLKEKEAADTSLRLISHELSNITSDIVNKCELYILDTEEGLNKDKSEKELLDEAVNTLRAVLKQTGRLADIAKKLFSLAKKEMNKGKILISLIILPFLTFFPFSSQASALVFETIDQGLYSGYSKKSFLVIKTKEEWQKVWNIHASAKLPLPGLPAIDFERKMLIAVFAREHSSAGYTIRIDNIEKTKDKILVHIVETKPERASLTSQAFIQPYQIAQIEKTDLPVEFVEIEIAAAKAGAVKGNTLEAKSYSIQSIPFESFEIPKEAGGPAIIFARYGSEAKVVYPAPEEKIPADAGDIVKKCQAALKDNLAKIINVEQENVAVKKYLSLNGKTALFNEEDYLRLINNPREQTVQIESATGNTAAEFRSQEIAIDEDNYLCRYLTFIYTRNKNYPDKIIISAVKLIKQSRQSTLPFYYE